MNSKRTSVQREDDSKEFIALGDEIREQDKRAVTISDYTMPLLMPHIDPLTIYISRNKPNTLDIAWNSAKHISELNQYIIAVVNFIYDTTDYEILSLNSVAELVYHFLPGAEVVINTCVPQAKVAITQ